MIDIYPYLFKKDSNLYSIFDNDLKIQINAP